MQVKKKQNQTWNNRLVPNREKSTSRLCIFTLLFNLYAVHIIRNARLDEAQAGTKIARRNINKFIHAYDTTLMAESRGTKSILMKVKEKSEKSWLKTQHSKNEDHGIQSHHFMANRWGNNANSDRLYFGGVPKSL